MIVFFFYFFSSRQQFLCVAQHYFDTMGYIVCFRSQTEAADPMATVSSFLTFIAYSTRFLPVFSANFVRTPMISSVQDGR